MSHTVVAFLGWWSFCHLPLLILWLCVLDKREKKEKKFISRAAHLPSNHSISLSISLSVASLFLSMSPLSLSFSSLYRLSLSAYNPSSNLSFYVLPKLTVSLFISTLLLHTHSLSFLLSFLVKHTNHLLLFHLSVFNTKFYFLPP